GSDIVIPAHHRHGPITLAVHTDGISAAAAGTIRRQLSASLDPLWPRLLDLAAPYRDRARRELTDSTRRRDFLLKLTDDEAFSTLAQQGSDAVIRLWEDRFVDALSPTPRNEP
ncbi:MAG: hypothetical protein IT440_10725, partial [Phycisphaeraceae bacterium]|nr:hypothetical protein [Phycisphaeraceae bacterium]